jgi:hypothetical protein
VLKPKRYRRCAPVETTPSNGLWLRSPAEVASEAVELLDEGGFQGLKLRLGRGPTSAKRTCVAPDCAMPGSTRGRRT